MSAIISKVLDSGNVSIQSFYCENNYTKTCMAGMYAMDYSICLEYLYSVHF